MLLRWNFRFLTFYFYKFWFYKTIFENYRNSISDYLRDFERFEPNLYKTEASRSTLIYNLIQYGFSKSTRWQNCSNFQNQANKSHILNYDKNRSVSKSHFKRLQIDQKNKCATKSPCYMWFWNEVGQLQWTG